MIVRVIAATVIDDMRLSPCGVCRVWQVYKAGFIGWGRMYHELLAGKCDRLKQDDGGSKYCYLGERYREYVNSPLHTSITAID